MKTLQHFNEFVKEITASASRKYKQEVLTKYKGDEVIQKYLKINYDPYEIFGISEKKLHKQVSCVAYPADNVFDLFYWLEKHNTGTDAAIKMCQETLAVIASEDQEAAALLEALICKDLSIGVDSKTINSVMPNLIPQFSCMLAQKYFEKPEKLSGKTFAITTKLDGFRLIALKDKFGNIKFYSRVGQLVEGLVEIEAELKANFPNDVALDGELTISNYFDMPSKDAYKAASKIIRLKGDTPKTGLTYRVFDIMTAEEFISQSCPAIYDARRALLDSYAGRAPHIEVLPVLYRGNDTSKITEFLDKITSEGGEGCILNLCDAPYVWNRTWNLQKVKKFADMELKVLDFEEGDGKYTGMLGAFICKYKNSTVKVGSGLTDAERIAIWQNKESYRGKLITINYFEESFSDGIPSLRFPIFKDFRTDKTEADF